MSSLSQALDDYLTIRRALGHELDRPGRLLARFVEWMDQVGHDTVTVALALEWVTLPEADPTSTVHPRRMTAVRGFAKHLQSIDPATEIPPVKLIPDRKHRAVPYLYSGAEIAGLMAAARALPIELRAVTYETLIGLLSVTGLRIGEAIGFDRDSLNVDAGVLVVHKSKYGKSRELPIHASTLEALDRYSNLRDRCYPHPSSSALFVSPAGNRLNYATVYGVFAKLRTTAGITPRLGSRRPRIHDLRHTFAVRTLVDWYSEGVDVNSRLPWLSTYLGHGGPAATYWYLTASPELMALVARRAEDALEVRP